MIIPKPIVEVNFQQEVAEPLQVGESLDEIKVKLSHIAVDESEVRSVDSVSKEQLPLFIPEQSSAVTKANKFSLLFVFLSITFII